MDPIFNSNFVPTFNADQFPGVLASPGDLGSLAQSIIGMGNQSQSILNALATGEVPENLFEGLQGMGITPPRPPRMDLFMAYSNMQAAHQQEETALGNRIKENSGAMLDAFYRNHHLVFDANGNPSVAADPAVVAPDRVDTASHTQRVTSATSALQSAQADRAAAQASLGSATQTAETARATAESLAAQAATDPTGIVPNSNPPVTYADAATRAAAEATAAEQAVQAARNELNAAEAAAAQAAAAQASAQAALTAAEQQAQIEQQNADIANLENRLNAGETTEQRQQRLAWQARQEETVRASFEGERQALQARQQQMLAQVQASGRQDPEVMEQLQRDEAALNTRIEKAVLLSQLPPGAAQAPPDSPLGQLYAQVQGDFAEFDQMRAGNQAELESSEAGREIRRFLAESRAFTASLPTREQAFDPNAMRAFASRMGLTVQAPVVDLGAPSLPTSLNFNRDLGIELPPEEQQQA